MSRKHPFVHTWDEDGIQRQAQIHQTDSGSEAVWDARYPGDPEPWQDLSYETVRHRDDEIDRDPEGD
ncbi:hypothetical protein ACGGAI_23860 [Streptomyces antibioticus]|uniref:hypothetical protein n=1 Tax=Streptomyces antibioticus TaxID=1890 RepID=UPI0037130FCC